jgi:type IX secretion system PorP/SprF family membrane protein
VSKKKILTYIFSIISGILYSQDIHFSQFSSSPLNLNPALTGNFRGNYRFCANFKNQWQSITVPYRTFSFSLENKINIRRNYLGIGLLFNNDKAGDSDFGTTQVKFSLSFGRYFSEDSTFSISAGLNIAYNQNSINYNNLHFGSQFTGGQFDPLMSSNENFSRNNFNYIDYSAGVNFNYLIAKSIPLNFGIGFLHINKPSRTFINEQLSNIDRKFNFHLSSEFRLKNDLSFIPQMVYYTQGKYAEIDYGGLFKIKLNNINFHNLYLGGWYRQSDAMVAAMNFDYQNINIGISYDINISKLRNASNGFGGIELSLIYILFKQRTMIIPIRKQCPTFM